jgi:hypothetical protein
LNLNLKMFEEEPESVYESGPERLILINKMARME